MLLVSIKGSFKHVILDVVFQTPHLDTIEGRFLRHAAEMENTLLYAQVIEGGQSIAIVSR